MDTFPHSHFKAQDVADTLRSIVAKVAKQSDIKQIQPIELFCGPVVQSGVAFALAEARQIQCIYLLDTSANIPMVRMVPLQSVTTLAVPFDDFYKDLLLTPGPWAQATEEAPSRLSIERLGEQLAKAVKKEVALIWNSKEQEPSARLFLHKLVSCAEDVLKNLKKDDLGAKALAEIKALKFVFKDSESVKAVKKAGTLEMSVGYSANVSEMDTDLTEQINKTL